MKRLQSTGAGTQRLVPCSDPISPGAGAAPLAEALQGRRRLANKRVAVIQSGGNIDRDLFVAVLAEPGPE